MSLVAGEIHSGAALSVPVVLATIRFGVCPRRACFGTAWGEPGQTIAACDRCGFRSEWTSYRFRPESPRTVCDRAAAKAARHVVLDAVATTATGLPARNLGELAERLRVLVAGDEAAIQRWVTDAQTWLAGRPDSRTKRHMLGHWIANQLGMPFAEAEILLSQR